MNNKVPPSYDDETGGELSGNRATVRSDDPLGALSGPKVTRTPKEVESLVLKDK